MKQALLILGPLAFLALAAFTAGVSLAPGLVFLHHALALISGWPPSLYYVGAGLAVIGTYVVFGCCLCLIAPLFNLLLGARLKPWRGPQTSTGALPWFLHCVFTLLPRLTVLEFLASTPFLNFYYQLMGMKIGRNVIINTSAIADPSLIELGDRVTLGGSCSVMAHYAQGGFLVIAPTRILAGATIGLRAIVMGGVTVGEKARVMAGSFVLPKTQIPAGETWGGIPARRLDAHGDEHPASTAQGAAN